MRNNIVHIGADKLTYEIRGIVALAEKINTSGVPVIWENIGDPVAKGDKLPLWMIDVIKKNLEDTSSFAYCPTKGLKDTREFLAQKNNALQGAQITKEDILFFNGLGDAISTLYHYLRREARVLGPSPAYSTHSSSEAAHAGTDHLTYNLDPSQDWIPDLDDMYNKIRYNPQISGILVINPGNPTGSITPKEILIQIVKIAKEFDLFIIVDEIYQNIVYHGKTHTPLATIIDDVPGISMQGISKDFPWPGSRCGWIESYNKKKDPLFERFIKTLEDAKMLEVCSTTLPQKVIPQIMTHPEYPAYHKKRNQFFEKRSEEIHRTLKDIPGVLCNKPHGSFYLSLVFEPGTLNNTQTLPVKDEIYTLIEPELKTAKPDKRFVLFLMASTGLCTVPLTSFNCDILGLRMTLLEQDDEQFTRTCHILKTAIEQYTHK